MRSSVVLLSGGVDSAVALALEQDHAVEALTVNYGQRHVREVDAAAKIARHYGIPHVIVDVDPVLFAGSALTDRAIPLPQQLAIEPDATYVPARNTVLIALGAARAETIGAGVVVLGANLDDAGAYPDCRPRYIEAMRDVLVEGTLRHVWIHTPLIGMHKPEILELARDLDVLDLCWSCYAGGDEPCGVCGACLARAT